jgi:flagellar motor switch protein FliN/FliY
MNSRQVIHEFLEQLRSVLSTTVEAPVSIVPAAMSTQAWRVRMSRSDHTVLTVTFDADGAAVLAAALHSSERRDHASIADAIHELCSHAIAAIAPGQNEGVAIELAPAELVSWQSAAGELVAGLQALPLSAPLTVGLALSDAREASRTPRASAPPPNEPIQEPERMGVLMDIDLPLVVRFGCIDMPLKALAALGPGSLIELARTPEDPVDVIVGGRVVARGEVVVVEGSYGIRIVELVGERDAVRRVEA